jgi:aspartyl protease family protein
MPQELTNLPAYIWLIVALVLLTFLRRIPGVRLIVSLISWVAIVGLLLLVFGQRARLDMDRQEVTGSELRVPMARDGHFWVRARIDGVERRMLVDSGATVSALSTATADAAKLDIEKGGLPVLLRTANGTIQAQTATIEELRLGNIVARDLAVVVSPGLGNVDIVGMNFLSRLKSWRVEGRTLILVPNHPQPVEEG